MDAHTLYPPDYIGRGIERLKKGDVVWVSGPQLPFGTDSGSRTVAAALRTRIGIGGASFRKATREIEVDTGYTGMWLRSTLLSHGGWNEEWEVNEDSELAARVRAAGGRIVCVPELGARYIPRNSLPALARQYWRYGRYRAKTCRAHPESMRPSHVLPPLLVLALLTAAFPRRWSSRMSRGAVAVYLVALALAPASRRGAGLRPAVGMPMALATMHLAWGVGFLAGCARFGLPVEAIRGLLASAPRARG
jgi:cellulose synthase/poly-beta-1,6-N-acetylglucosamine synthase-like glycosyltransferase